MLALEAIAFTVLSHIAVHLYRRHFSAHAPRLTPRTTRRASHRRRRRATIQPWHPLSYSQRDDWITDPTALEF